MFLSLILFFGIVVCAIGVLGLRRGAVAVFAGLGLIIVLLWAFMAWSDYGNRHSAHTSLKELTPLYPSLQGPAPVLPDIWISVRYRGGNPDVTASVNADLQNLPTLKGVHMVTTGQESPQLYVTVSRIGRGNQKWYWSVVEVKSFRILGSQFTNTVAGCEVGIANTVTAFRLSNTE